LKRKEKDEKKESPLVSIRILDGIKDALLELNIHNELNLLP
jgi:hypothetical protein